MMTSIATAVVWGLFVMHTPGSGVHYDTTERHGIMRNCVVSAAMHNEWYMNTVVWGGKDLYFCKRIEE